MCSISSYRFLCYQLLTEVLNRFADESSAWMILELLENNPPMRPAAISFVKQKIDDSLKKLKENSDVCWICREIDICSNTDLF